MEIHDLKNNITSIRQDSLNQKCPIELTEFIWGKELLDAFNLMKIPGNDVIVGPALFDQTVSKYRLREFKEKTFITKK